MSLPAAALGTPGRLTRALVCQTEGCRRHPVYQVARDGRSKLACRRCMQFLLTVGWSLVVER